LAAFLAFLILIIAVLKNLVDNYSAWPSYVGIGLAVVIAVGAWMQIQATGGVESLKTEATSMVPAAAGPSTQAPPAPSEPSTPPPARGAPPPPPAPDPPRRGPPGAPAAGPPPPRRDARYPRRDVRSTRLVGGGVERGTHLVVLGVRPTRSDPAYSRLRRRTRSS